MGGEEPSLLLYLLSGFVVVVCSYTGTLVRVVAVFTSFVLASTDINCKGLVAKWNPKLKFSSQLYFASSP